MNGLDLSLCMIVRDEEKTIERCLSSAASYVSEMIVIDTGSTDRSREIAERYGAAVISVPWEYDFAIARNQGLELATKKWILVLDADEELVIPYLDYLPGLLEQDDVYGYFVKLINYVGSCPGEEYVTDSVCRLFRNDPRIRFAGAIHEEVTASILSIPGARIEFSEISVHHYGYISDVIIKKNKNERNMTIIQESLKRQPEDLQLQYALGTEYFQREEYAKALQIFESLLPRVPVFNGFASDLLLKTSYALRETGRNQEAWQLIKEGLTFFPDFTDLLELKAMIQIDNENYQEAITTLAQAIQLGDVSLKYTSSSGSGTYRSHFLAGLACEHAYRWEDAENHFHKALLYHPEYLPAWQRWPILAISLNHTTKALDFILKHSKKLPITVWNLIIRAAVNRRNFRLAEQAAALKPFENSLDTLLEALILTNKNKVEEAKSLLTRLLNESPYQTSAYLYLWALAMKSNDALSAIAYLNKLSALDPSFSPFETMLSGNQPSAMQESACRQLQQVLLHIGAWDVFNAFQNKLPHPLPWAWLPIHMLAAWLDAPHQSKHDLIRLCLKRQDTMTYHEQLFAGVLAYDCSDYMVSYEFFKAAHEKFPNRIEAMVGLSHVLVGKAAAHSNLKHMRPLVSGLRFLILSVN